MAVGIYRGVNNVARQVSEQYRGVNNVARKIIEEYRGVNNVARRIYVNSNYNYTFTTNDGAEDSVTFSNYTLEVENETLTIAVTAVGNEKGSGRLIGMYLYGDLAGKEISFTYSARGHVLAYSAIEYIEQDESNNKLHTTALSGEGTLTRKIEEDTHRLRFSIWFSQGVDRGSFDLTITNLTIGGVSVF